MPLVPEFYDGSAWKTLNSSNASVSSVGITAGTGINVSGSPITTSGTISLTLGNIPITALSGYPSDSVKLLQGNGVWAQPILNGSTYVFNGANLSSVQSLDCLRLVVGDASVFPFFAFLPTLQVNNGYVFLNSTQTTVSGFSYYKYQFDSWAAGYWAGGGLALSMKCVGSIAAVEFEATSSIKKKYILENLNAFSSDLKKKFDSIDFVKYAWKDPMKEGEGQFFGYIAENVAEQFPELVDMSHLEFAPNIFQMGIAKKTSKNVHKISCKNSFNAKTGDKIQFFVETENHKKTFEGVVCEKIDDFEMAVEFNEKSPPDGEIFVYGVFEEVPLVSKTRFHDMVSSRVRILIDDFKILAEKVNFLELKIKNMI